MTDALCDMVAASLNGGALRIYDGAGTGRRLLAELPFPTPAFHPAVNQSARSYPLKAEAIADGQARWYCCVQADGKTEILSGPVYSGDPRAKTDGLVMRSASIQKYAEIILDTYELGVH